jgi:hypothetical protein
MQLLWDPDESHQYEHEVTLEGSRQHLTRSDRAP